MTTATKPATFKSSILGTVELHSYVDPHPGKVGTDRVPTTCGRCGGSGYFNCFRHIYAGRCFGCDGTGKDTISVATARKWARSDAFATEYADEIAAYWAEFEAAQEVARKAEEFAAHWDEAHAENIRRAALVQGFLAEVGDKIAGVEVTVKVAKYIEGSWNRSSSMFIIAETAAGQVIKIFGSSNSLFGLQRDDQATITTAKVKAHESWNGQEQTVLSHVKVEKNEEVS